jgi:hypothetical protein
MMSPGFIAQLGNLILAGIGFEQSMVNHPGDTVIMRPSSQRRGQPACTGPDNFVHFIGAVFSAGAITTVTAGFCSRLGGRLIQT